MSTTVRATNDEIGRRIGLGHSGVSRIRSGDRFPSLATMRRIERVYSWTLEDQVAARERGTFEYAHEFERKVKELGDREGDSDRADGAEQA